MSSPNLLSQAIARNSSLALSFVTPTGVRHFRSRFLQEFPEGFWIQSVEEERASIDELIAHEQQCALSFVSGDRKLLFKCPIYKRLERVKISDTFNCEALLLPFPTDPKEIQRRDWYRARVSDSLLNDLQVEMWRIPDHVDLREKPTSAQLIDCRIRDMSATGIGLTLQVPGRDAPPIVTGQRVRVEMSGIFGSVLVEGRTRYVSDKGSRHPSRLGATFSGLDDSLTGRKNANEITRLVAGIQREELRRQRREMVA